MEHPLLFFDFDVHPMRNYTPLLKTLSLKKGDRVWFEGVDGKVDHPTETRAILSIPILER